MGYWKNILQERGGGWEESLCEPLVNNYLPHRFEVGKISLSAIKNLICKVSNLVT